MVLNVRLVIKRPSKNHFQKIPLGVLLFRRGSLSFIECVCCACRIQYDDDVTLHCLLCLLHNNVVSLWRNCVTTELVSLYYRIEESARTLVVLDVDG